MVCGVLASVGAHFLHSLDSYFQLAIDRLFAPLGEFMSYDVTPVFFLCCAPFVATRRISCLPWAIAVPFAIWIVQTVFFRISYNLVPQVDDLPLRAFYLGLQGILFGGLLTVSLSRIYHVRITNRAGMLGALGGLILWLPSIVEVIFYEMKRPPPQFEALFVMFQIIGYVAVVTLPSIEIEHLIRQADSTTITPNTSQF